MAGGTKKDWRAVVLVDIEKKNWGPWLREAQLCWAVCTPSGPGMNTHIHTHGYHSIFSTYIRTHMAWIIIRTFYLTSIYHTPFHNPSKSTHTLLYNNNLACFIFPVRKMDNSNNRITYRLFGHNQITYRLLFV